MVQAGAGDLGRLEGSLCRRGLDQNRSLLVCGVRVKVVQGVDFVRE